MAIATKKYGDATTAGQEPAAAAARDSAQDLASAVSASNHVAQSASAAGETSVAKGVASVSSRIEQVQSKARSNMEKTMKTAEEFISFGQGNVEAVLKSGQIWAAGVQDLSKEMAATAQAQLDHTMAAMRALSSVKSLKEAVDLQASLARSSLEKAVSEAGRVTDASMKLAEQTLAPISARVSLAVEKLGHPVG
jgi:phasin family protein